MQSFDPVTTQGLSITNLFIIELVISALLLTFVGGWLGWVLFRFRARPGDVTDPSQIRGNRNLELAWTITPAVVLAVMFVLVIQTMRTVNAAQPGAQTLTVVGHQWWWEFDYPDQQVITANELYVPVGSPLQLSLQSIDVIHSFHVPQFGWMQDTVPGKANQMSILVTRPGVFDGTCNQYCGVQHAWMRILVVAEPTDQFNAWIQQQRQLVTSTGSPGEQIFLQNTCSSCHAIRGLVATANIGPDLTHVASRATLGAGVIVNTTANLKSWISNPQAIKPGVLMPSFGNLSDADLDALVAFLEGLK